MTVKERKGKSSLSVFREEIIHIKIGAKTGSLEIAFFIVAGKRIRENIRLIRHQKAGTEEKLSTGTQ